MASAGSRCLSPRSLVATLYLSCWPASSPCMSSVISQAEGSGICALFFSFVLGLVFGVGLYVSGMTQPSKVLGFLDILGDWDPSLAFVMAGAVAVGLVAFSFARPSWPDVSGYELRLPRITEIDAPLVVGQSRLRGLVGAFPAYAQAQASSTVGFLDWRALVFVVSMAAGMVMKRAYRGRIRSQVAGEQGRVRRPSSSLKMVCPAAKSFVRREMRPGSLALEGSDHQPSRADHHVNSDSYDKGDGLGVFSQALAKGNIIP